jgi:Tfp pilus assembly protein PilN
MKKLITFILFINYVLTFSQKNIDKELAEVEKFANKIIENNPDKILHYYKLNRYGRERILDKYGQIIPEAEYLDKVPLSKFLV